MQQTDQGTTDRVIKTLGKGKPEVKRGWVTLIVLEILEGSSHLHNFCSSLVKRTVKQCPSVPSVVNLLSDSAGLNSASNVQHHLF